jgi:hypothetical protein
MSETVYMADVYDKEGNLVRVEVYKTNGDFLFQSLWDPNDEQVSAKREAFRKWTKTMAERLGYEPLE